MAIAAFLVLFGGGFAVLVPVETPSDTKVRRVAAILVSTALMMIGLLTFAQKQVCVSLGGEWTAGNNVCRNEWGGGVPFLPMGAGD
jgi:xanthine/uracil permease